MITPPAYGELSGHAFGFKKMETPLVETLWYSDVQN